MEKGKYYIYLMLLCTSLQVFPYEIYALPKIVPTQIIFHINDFSKRFITFPAESASLTNASNYNSALNAGKIIRITPQRSLFLSIPAYIAYTILLIIGAALLRKYELSRIRLKTQIKLANIEALRLKELDLMKSRFFTNISHELRTPLTLIKGPLDQMHDETHDPKKKKMISLMKSNTDRLLTLINQLLDLSRLENNEYKLRVSKGDAVQNLKSFVDSFSTMALQKQIELKFTVSSIVRQPLILDDFYFDRDVLEKIMANILHNALNFTHQDGRITISLCIRKHRTGSKFFEITITDTGIGIEKKKLPFIFDRYYQVDDIAGGHYAGTGIGLAYVKELVELHKGQIAVKSQPGKGSTFRVRLPVGIEFYDPSQIIGNPDFPSHEQYNGFSNMPELFELSNHHPTHDNDEKPLVMIVEDHADVRFFICESLKDFYNIIAVCNAPEALTIASERMPDLIISDVMMPGMDGYEFCHNIKTAIATSHIPVIMLTARSDDLDKIHGLETGADDYLTKPFNAIELRLRIKNMIAYRKGLRSKFHEKTVVKPSEIMVTSRDSAFMEKLLRIVEQNMDKEHFTVEELAALVNMSSSQLHRKLKAIINQSTVQFIKSVKMHRAKELMEKNAGNIAEIAYKVGFSDPGHFTKTFKAFFNMLPSEVKKKV
jgi:signal transduction histidine kinase/DNA-binding response OmpR family regulator